MDHQPLDDAIQVVIRVPAAAWALPLLFENHEKILFFTAACL